MADVGSANVNITADDSDARRQLKGFSGFLKQTASVATGVWAGVAAFEGIKESVRGVWEGTIGANASMETYQNTLSVVLKSSEKAAATLEWAKQFAGSTPFEIPGIVEATTRLETYGISAQKNLGTIGDMASVMGKPLMQAVEAVADAQTGELERLKEFGITKQMLIDKSAAMGKSEVVNAKGQITDMEGLNEALFAIMKERYEGGMELQSQTFLGMVSNAKDSMGQIATELSRPIFEKLKSGLRSILPIMGAVTEIIKGEWFAATDILTDAFGAEKTDKIENFFLMLSSGIRQAMQWIRSFTPTIQNLMDIAIGLGPTFEIVGGAIAVAFIKVAEVLPPIVNKITEIGAAITNWQGFAPVVTGLVAAFITYKTTIFAIAKAQAAYNLVMTISTALMRAHRAAHLAMIISGGGLKGVLLALKVAMRSLNITMLANPIVLVIALIVGLGVALVVAYKKSETFRNVINGAWSAIKTGFMAFINFFTTTLPAWVTSVVSWFTTLKAQTVAKITELVIAILNWWTNLKSQSSSKISELITSLVNWFTNLKNQVVGRIMVLVNQVLTWWNTLKMRTGAAIQLLIGEAVRIFSSLQARVMLIIQPFINFFVRSFENLKLLVLGIISIFISLFTGDMEGFKLGVLAIISAFKDQAINIFTLFKTVVTSTIRAWWTGVLLIFTTARNTLINIAIAIKNGVVNGFLALKNAAIQAFQLWWTGVKIMFTSGKAFLISAALAIKNGVINGFLALKNGAINAIKALVSAVINWFSNLRSNATNSVNNIKSSVVNGFNSAKDSAVNAVRNLYNSVTTWLGNVKSKFTDMKNKIINTVSGIDLYSIGKDIIQGLINGIGSMARRAAQKVADIGSDIKSAISKVLDRRSPSKEMIKIGIDTIKGLIIGLDQLVGDVKKKSVQIAHAAMPQPNKLFRFNGQDPISKYFNAVIEDGDYLNDWLTHLPSQIRNQVKGLGQNLSKYEGLSSSSGSATHNHYWNVSADEINEVNKLIAMIEGVQQSVRKGVF